MTTFSRRGFLAASAAMLAASHFPIRAYGQDAAAIRLAATSRTLDIDNRPATVFGLAGPNGQGLLLDPGERFRVDLTNDHSSARPDSPERSGRRPGYAAAASSAQ
jgi:hypothetical protein